MTTPELTAAEEKLVNPPVGEGPEKTKAVVTHVLGFFTLFIGPLVMYFAFRKNSSPWLRAHLDEAVNYHILVVIGVVVLTVLAVVFTSFDLPGIGFVLFALAGLIVVANFIFSFLAIVWAARGKSFHFPLDIQMVK